MKIHELKTDTWVYDAVECFDMTFQIRKNDRNFAPGDILHLREAKYISRADIPLIYTGRECYAKITHILYGPVYGLEKGWVILSFQNTINKQDFLKKASAGKLEDHWDHRPGQDDK